MSELVYILALASLVFIFAHRPASLFMAAEDYSRRRNLWLILTLAAFLSPNFWVYAAIVILLLGYTRKSETNPAALFFFLLFVLPNALAQVPGIGLLEDLFMLSHPRILELFVLFPAYLALRRESASLPFGRNWPDKALAAYLLLHFSILLRDTTPTNAIRHGFYAAIGVFLPYYVFSRSLRNVQAFRDVLCSFVIACMILAIIGVLEFFKFWLLYRRVLGELGLVEGMTFAQLRDGMLRVTAAAGHPILLGFFMLIAIGFYLYLQRLIPNKLSRWLGLLLLAAGLAVALSRGPWLGTAFLLLVFLAAGRSPARSLINLGAAAMAAVALLAVLPGGERVINLLPYVGTVEQENIEYREKLIANSMIVIQRNLWFGSATFLETPEMEEMRQGQGIIDIVNSYLAITLSLGLAGLALFAGFFVLTLSGIYRAMRSIPDRDSEEYRLGQALLATILAILFTITTASSILNAPLVYWSVAGMGVAYARMVRR
jgi:O-antigen ligase